MVERQTSPVLIELNPKGAMAFAGFRSTPLTLAVEGSQGAFNKPFVLHGAEVGAEIEALKHHVARVRWQEISGVGDLSDTAVAEAYADVVRGLDGRFSPAFQRDRLDRILKGPVSPEDVVDFFHTLASGREIDGARSFRLAIDRLFARSGVILSFGGQQSLFALVVLSLWMRQPRKLPIVVCSEGKIPMSAGRLEHFATNVALFDDLTAEINRVFGTPIEEIEKAYRVWQISRKAGDGKPKATTPKYITINTAKVFLGVLTRARTEREISRLALQRPAPVMFAFDRSVIGLTHGTSTSDPGAYIAAAASSLMRQLERLLGDHSLSNAVPSAGGILEVALEILVKVRGGTYSDADIIEMGMDFNALQWHVDAVRPQIGDATLGELTGLFSSVQMLLARFKSWREFEGAPGARAAVDGEAVEIAVALLESARDAQRLFTPEANSRIDKVLERASAAEAPNQQEGIVRSGENLAAISAESLGRIAVDRAVSNPGPDDPSEAMVRYVRQNGSNMIKLAKRRNWPWLNWLNTVLD